MSEQDPFGWIDASPDGAWDRLLGWRDAVMAAHEPDQLADRDISGPRWSISTPGETLRFFDQRASLMKHLALILAADPHFDPSNLVDLDSWMQAVMLCSTQGESRSRSSRSRASLRTEHEGNTVRPLFDFIGAAALFGRDIQLRRHLLRPVLSESDIQGLALRDMLYQRIFLQFAIRQNRGQLQTAPELQVDDGQNPQASKQLLHYLRVLWLPTAADPLHDGHMLTMLELAAVEACEKIVLRP